MEFQDYHPELEFPPQKGPQKYSPKFDLPPPAIMYSRRKAKPSEVDWSKFEAVPFEVLKAIIAKYKDMPFMLTKAIDSIVELVAIIQDIHHRTKYGVGDPNNHPRPSWSSVLLRMAGTPYNHPDKTQAIIHDRWCDSAPYVRPWHGYREYREVYEFLRPIVFTDMSLYDFIVKNSATYTENLDVVERERFDFNYRTYWHKWSQVRAKAKELILTCLLHPDIDKDGDIGRAVEPLVNLQPQIKERSDMSNPTGENTYTARYLKQRAQRLAGGHGLWPEFTRVLKQLAPADSTSINEQDVLDMFELFLRLALDIWGTYTADLSNHVPNPRTAAYFCGLQKCIHGFQSRIEDPAASESLHVRQLFANAGIISSWEFMFHFVLPTLVRSTPRPELTRLGFYIYRWVLRAATHPDVDPSGRIKDALARMFNLDPLSDDLPFDQIPDHNEFDPVRRFYIPEGLLPLINQFERFHERCPDPYTGPADPCLDLDTSPANPELDTSPTNPEVPENPEVEPQPPQVKDFTHPSEPTEDCYICREEFEPGTCYKLDACQHPYHFDCLQTWFEHKLHIGTVLCPYCSALIYPANHESLSMAESLQMKPYWANQTWWDEYILTEAFQEDIRQAEIEMAQL
ncbi:hypothetical protein CC80DRAFT_553440 [Byssothecium circinans]|uniref:RING-type domain-containing protein n=1 Tax=Byssothecium circinans TaxID=147558 RepID=A0A6A5TG47_9PLEO|nr:hypothetical protein CC80DRAFT_553440 [Byssothecium circinans]